MLVTQKRRALVLRTARCWWPQTAEEAIGALSAAPVVTVVQCRPEITAALERWTFRATPFLTLLVDLSLGEDALWRELHTLGKRQIKKAQKLGAELTVGQHEEAAFAVINDSIRRQGYRPPISRVEWADVLSYSDLFVARLEGEVLAAHVLPTDRSTRAQLLFSATVERATSRFKDEIGPLNRLLHWFEFQHYREAGVPVYDFGGVVLDPGHPLHGIGLFKQSFGGRIVAEDVVRLARNPALRAALSIAVQSRAAAARIDPASLADAAAYSQAPLPARPGGSEPAAASADGAALPGRTG